MNLFRQTPDGSLDRQYLRISAVYRLMDRRGLTKERAIELLTERQVSKARALVELWLSGPFRRRATQPAA